jgi:hypothetical protein
MAMSVKFDGPQNRLISGLYNQGKETDDAGVRIDGICSNCEQWDAELVNGFCRDDECKLSRQEKKVKDGSAFKYSTDVLGKDGMPGTSIERGSKKYFVKRKK